MPELLFQTSDSRLHQQGLVWTLKLQITKLALIDEIRVSYQNLSFPRSAQVTEMCGHNTFRGESMNMTTDGKLAKLLAKKKKRKFRIELCPSDYHFTANTCPHLVRCHPYNAFLEMTRYWEIDSPQIKAGVYINRGPGERPFLQS